MPFLASSLISRAVLRSVVLRSVVLRSVVLRSVVLRSVVLRSVVLRSVTLCSFIFGAMLLSCSRDNAPKNTTQNTNESAQTASMNLAETAEKPSAAKVFALQKVDEAVSGKRPDFAWTEGKTIVKLSDASKGKPVFLNFWGTWCPPCRRELPDIVQLHKEYGDKVVFIGIAMENEEKASKALPIVSTFAQKNNLNYINLVGDDKFIGQISTVYGDIQAVPTTFIIDKNGVIAEKMIGGKTKDEFLTALKKVL